MPGGFGKIRRESFKGFFVREACLLAQRYIIREITRPAVATCLLLVFMFGAYIATRYWADAAQGELPGGAAFILIILRIIIALEVLIPTTLFLSVVAALNRMYRDSEMTALAACGIGPAVIFRAVFRLGVAAALIVACLSIEIRPWAWSQFFRLKTEAKAGFDISRLKSGTFYELWKGKRVFYASAVNSANATASGVFIKTRRDDAVDVISAGRARQIRGSKRGAPVLLLQNGREYQFSGTDENEMVLEFERMVMVVEPAVITRELKVKSVKFSVLERSDDRKSVAELQWRLVAPVSTVLLALLGVPLSSTGPRSVRLGPAPVAVAVFGVYYYLAAMLKKLVASGSLGIFPGVWLSQLFLLVLLVISVLYFRRNSSL